MKSKKRKKQENLHDDIVFFFQFIPKKLHDIFQSRTQPKVEFKRNF